MRNITREILNGEVITIPITENSHTFLEEIALVVEMLIIAYVEIKVMVINILNLKEAVIKDDLVKVHGEADHMPDEPMAEANFLIKMTSVSGLGHPSYKGIPQHCYICSLCSNKGHYEHQCHYAQQIMNHATAASIKAHQQEDAA